MKHGNIRSLQDYRDTVWSWEFLNDCFKPTSIRVGDADGIVERNSHLLLLETKKPGIEIPKGQYRMFENLSLTGLVTVFVIWGQRNQPSQLQVFYPYPKYITSRMMIAGESELKGWVRRWFLYADRYSYKQVLLQAMRKDADEILREFLAAKDVEIAA